MIYLKLLHNTKYLLMKEGKDKIALNRSVIANFTLKITYVFSNR